MDIRLSEHQRRAKQRSSQQQQQQLALQKSNTVDAISRFPYQQQHQRRRSDDAGDSAESAASNNDAADATFEIGEGQEDGSSPFASSLVSAPPGGTFFDPDESFIMDGSSASLMIQESSTFPNEEEEEQERQRQRRLQLPEQASSWNFAMEHRIFLKAVLELIAQRDKFATEVGMNDPNVLKSGPLKKASHLMRGIWKVKYVEIRRGMFSYYEDAVSSDIGAAGSNNNTAAGADTPQQHLQREKSQSQLTSQSLLRKNIPLEASSCHCRAVRLHQNAFNITPRGAIFELAIGGRPKRLWMANSRSERQAWIQAIHDAMVGGSVTRGGNASLSSSSRHHHSQHHQQQATGSDGSDLKKYLKVQGQLKGAKNKDEYIVALRSIFRHELNVPVKWIIEQADQEAKKEGTPSSGAGNGRDGTGAFHEQDVKFGVDQLFKDLQRDTVQMNGDVYHGNSGHAPERITGALARKLMVCGRRSYEDDNDQSEAAPPTASKYDMSESQALAYARDILLSGNRTRSGGDSYFCVNTLCKNGELVVVVPNSAEAEPLSITITRDDDGGDGAGGRDMHSKVGWLRTRRRTKNSWVKAYFVLSEGTLSFYEQALPRPHGLQGQLAIAEATISVSREEQKAGAVNGANQAKTFVLTIVAKDKSERQILFESVERLLVWAYALECSAKAKGGAAPAPLLKAMKNVMRRMPRVSVVQTPKDPNRQSTGSAPEEIMLKGEGASSAEAALKEHVANLGLDMGAIEERLADYANQASTVVKVAIEAGTVYKICTLDPQGEEKEDTWAVVDATFLQDFRVSGGPFGRIMRGEEIVRVDVTRCSPVPRHARKTQSSSDRHRSKSPNSPNRRMQRLLRTFSDEGEKRDRDNGQR